MKKNSDQDLLGTTFPLFDYRSGAFRQKMLNHFQSNGWKLWTDIEIMQGKKIRPGYIFQGKRLTDLKTSAMTQQPLCCSRVVCHNWFAINSVDIPLGKSNPMILTAQP